MSQKGHLNHLIWLIIATVFISTSGPLGKVTDMPTPVIIWWRSGLATLLLVAFCLYKGISIKIKTKKDRWAFLLAGIFMGAHWLTYFYALKASNVAIGMLSLFTFPILVSLLEPFFIRTKLDIFHVFLGILVLTGIYIMSPDFNLDNGEFKGILFGLLSALCYAIRILILKGYVQQYHGTMLMFYQMLIIFVMLIPVAFVMDMSNITTEYPYIILLALVTTAIGHTLFINSLKYFKASTASIIGSSQPVFGIIIAFFFLNETPTIHTFVGGGLILATVFIESVRSKKDTKR